MEAARLAKSPSFCKDKISYKKRDKVYKLIGPSKPVNKANVRQKQPQEHHSSSLKQVLFILRIITMTSITNISKTEALVLQQLVSVPAGSELYGSAMVKASSGTLKMGSIYVILGRLQDKGLVESRREELSPDSKQAVPRRLYKVTGTGRRVVAAHEASARGFAAAFG
ncbi:MAG: helix-turn-helix transcriptional regulator [Pseudomonadota bacterium]